MDGSVGGSYALARFNKNGSLDTTFNGTGVRSVPRTPGTPGTEQGMGFFIQQDEKILIAGESSDNLRLLRINKDGSLDTTFGAGTGIVTQNLGGIDQAYDVSVQSSGKILVTGRTGANLFVERFWSTGVVDTTFATAGIYTLAGNGYGTRIKVLPNDQILVLGSVTADFHVLKMSVDGSLDTTFGTAGIAHINIGPGDYGYNMEVLASGKIIIGGNDGSSNYALARLHSNGSLDTTYGTLGFATLAEPLGFYNFYQYTSMAMLPNEQIIVGGSSLTTAGVNYARFNEDGFVDTTFGTGGKFSTPVALSGASVVIAQPDGKILFGMSDTNNTTSYFVRYR
jgi:uncharacterized delta-60 repeat protein